jgi:hypothetical protein
LATKHKVYHFWQGQGVLIDCPSIECGRDATPSPNTVHDIAKSGARSIDCAFRYLYNANWE